VFLLCTKANTQHTTKAAQWFGIPTRAEKNFTPVGRAVSATLDIASGIADLLDLW
jgi:hypothetical protein